MCTCTGSAAELSTEQPRGFVGFVLFETSARLPLRLPVKDLNDFVNISAPESIININTHAHRELRGDILRWCVDLILFHPMRPSRGTFSCGSRSSLPHAQSAGLSLQLTRCLYVDGDLFFQLSSLMSPVQTRSLIPPGQRTRVIGVASLLLALLAIFNWIWVLISVLCTSKKSIISSKAMLLWNLRLIVVMIS